MHLVHLRGPAANHTPALVVNSGLGAVPLRALQDAVRPSAEASGSSGWFLGPGQEPYTPCPWGQQPKVVGGCPDRSCSASEYRRPRPWTKAILVPESRHDCSYARKIHFKYSMSQYASILLLLPPPPQLQVNSHMLQDGGFCFCSL